jgi:hypothetical protein
MYQSLRQPITKKHIIAQNFILSEFKKLTFEAMLFSQ